MKSVQLVLASTSPRRIELMAQAGFKVSLLKPEVDESVRKNESASSMVKRLSQSKARRGAELLGKIKTDFALIISADTTVVWPGGTRVIGKPGSRFEAIRMVSTLQGRSHQVLTGYTLLLWGSEGRVLTTRTRVVRTIVRIRKLSRAQVIEYVDSGESMDKAGAYAAQGRGKMLIEEICGSYTNVVGLPMAQLCQDIEEVMKSVRGAKLVD